MELQPNILFHNRYRLIERKGSGSFGEVWLARDEQTGIEVAVKIYIALDERGVEEFRAEYKTAFALNHPHLLHANFFDVCEQRPYLVMQYCPTSAVSLVGTIDEPTAWKFIRDVADGLAYLHEQDVVHRDIKPDNILRDSNGRFLISDFGLSMRMRSTLRRNSTRQQNADNIAGTIGYMAPELFMANAEAVKATDIWALGATLYEMLTGELPFMGQGGVMQLHGAEIPVLKGEYSQNLKDTISACLAKDTWNRPTALKLIKNVDAKLNGDKPQSNPFPSWNITFKIIVICLSVSLGFGIYKHLSSNENIERESVIEPVDTIQTDPISSPQEINKPLTMYVKNYSILDISGEILFHYTGTIQSNVPHGKGKAIYSDGREYEGCFVNGKREDDHAKFKFSDGNIYEGSFIDDHIGDGILTSFQPNTFGTYFKGKFKADKPYTGTWYDKDGKVISKVVLGHKIFYGFDNV